MSIQMEEVLRAGYVGRGMELPCPFWAHRSPSTSTSSPTPKLFKPMFGPFPAALSSLENGEWAENSTLAIMA